MNNLAQYFVHIAENLNILADEFEMDLSAIHTVAFSPHIGYEKWWWMDVNEEMYVLVERGWHHNLEVVMEGHYSDYQQPPEVMQ